MKINDSDENSMFFTKIDENVLFQVVCAVRTPAPDAARHAKVRVLVCADGAQLTPELVAEHVTHGVAL